MQALNEPEFTESLESHLEHVGAGGDQLTVQLRSGEPVVLVPESEIKRLNAIIDERTAAIEKAGPGSVGRASDEEAATRVTEIDFAADPEGFLNRAATNEDLLIERPGGWNVVLLSERSLGGFATTIEILSEPVSALRLLQSIAEANRWSDLAEAAE